MFSAAEPLIHDDDDDDFDHATHLMAVVDSIGCGRGHSKPQCSKCGRVSDVSVTSTNVFYGIRGRCAKK